MTIPSSADRASRAPDRDKTPIALGLGAGPRLRQLVVWDTGETELD